MSRFYRWLTITAPATVGAELTVQCLVHPCPEHAAGAVFAWVWTAICLKRNK